VKRLAFFFGIPFLGATLAITVAAETPSPPPDDRYGPSPTNYKEIVMKWLEQQLIDPSSARVEWLDEPKPTDAGKGGEHLYGYLVHFRVDARNRFGGYTGKQNHAALIRNGEVIKGFGFGY
jgi:hypothetical protein